MFLNVVYIDWSVAAVVFLSRDLTSRLLPSCYQVAVIPAQAGIHFDLRDLIQEQMDYSPLPRLALRAIRSANVRSGILPPQSRFRGNDDSLLICLACSVDLTSLFC